MSWCKAPLGVNSRCGCDVPPTLTAATRAEELMSNCRHTAVAPCSDQNSCAASPTPRCLNPLGLDILQSREALPRRKKAQPCSTCQASDVRNITARDRHSMSCLSHLLRRPPPPPPPHKLMCKLYTSQLTIHPHLHPHSHTSTPKSMSTHTQSNTFAPRPLAAACHSTS
eukprot:362730-Chlamydomonas_euryale.AAC.3